MKAWIICACVDQSVGFRDRQGGRLHFLEPHHLYLARGSLSKVFPIDCKPEDCTKYAQVFVDSGGLQSAGGIDLECLDILRGDFVQMELTKEGDQGGPGDTGDMIMAGRAQGFGILEVFVAEAFESDGGAIFDAEPL